jgi:hypothetical protein
VKTWFQSLLFQILNLCRYVEVIYPAGLSSQCCGMLFNSRGGGLYALNPVDHPQRESAYRAP